MFQVIIRNGKITLYAQNVTGSQWTIHAHKAYNYRTRGVAEMVARHRNATVVQLPRIVRMTELDSLLDPFAQFPRNEGIG